MASGGHFPGGRPGNFPPQCKCIREVASRGYFPGGGPGSSRHNANVYEKWFPEAISQGAVREAPARTTTIFERLAQEAQDRLRPSRSSGNVPEITALGPARGSGRFRSQCHVLKHGQVLGSSWAATAWPSKAERSGKAKRYSPRTYRRSSCVAHRNHDNHQHHPSCHDDHRHHQLWRPFLLVMLSKTCASYFDGRGLRKSSEPYRANALQVSFPSRPLLLMTFSKPCVPHFPGRG